MKFDPSDAKTRGWLMFVLTLLGTAIGAISTYSAVMTAKHQEWNHEGFEAGTQLGRDQIQDVEIGHLKAWQDAHTSTMNAVEPFLLEWPDTRRQLEEIHLFLVRRFQMPTSQPESIPPGYNVEPADGCPSLLRAPKSGVIAGECAQRPWDAP